MDDRKLNIGVVGLGSMGVQHCRNIVAHVPEMRLAAVADADAAQARAIGQELNVPWFSDNGELVGRGGCEAVLIATPHPLHAPMAEQAFAAGLHVLSEKPLAETVSAADRMLAAARKARRVLGVMFQMRFIPACRRALEIVRSGELGRIIRASLIAPIYRSQAYYDAGRWRATWVGEGGGVLLNQSPHIVDLFVNLTGMPTWVHGTVGTLMHDIEVEDCAQALLRYEGGGFGYLYTSTIEPGPAESIEIFAEKGKIFYRDGAITCYRFDRPISEFTRDNTDMWGKPAVTPLPLEIENRPTGHVDVMRNFARHILHGEELLCDGERALGQIELANAIIYSGHTGQPVNLPLDRAAYNSLLGKLREGSRYATKSDQMLRITDPAFLKKR